MEYYIMNPKEKYFSYMIIGCSDKKVNLPIKETDKIKKIKNPFKQISRNVLGYIVITLDLFLTSLSIIFIWYLQHHINKHIKTYDKLTLQTKDFCLTFNNFPKKKSNSQLDGRLLLKVELLQ